MHRDKKIGFALGILLIGIVAAFFFRNEPDPFADLPPLEDPGSLDAQIAEKPITPYAASEETGILAPPNNPWELPEIYRSNQSPSMQSEGLPISAGAPAPINLANPIPTPDTALPNNRAIEVGSPFGSAETIPAKPAQELPLPENSAWKTVPEQPSPNPAVAPSNLVKHTPQPDSLTASPTMYKIKPGDTLSVLAEKHLGSSRRYMEIYEANRDKLRNPNDIQVGMQIRIPPRVSFTGENTAAPPPQEKSTTILPPPEEASRFTPFSRSPLTPGRW